MKKIFVFISCFWLYSFAPSFGFSQNLQSQVDSLENRLKVSDEDSNRVKILFGLSNRLSMNDPAKSLAYAEQSLALAQKLGLKKYVIYSYQRIAGYYYYKSDLKLATEYSMKAIEIIEKINDRKSLAVAYSNLSALLSRKSENKQALVYLDKALAISEELRDSLHIANNLTNKGMLYMNESNYTTALNYFMQALKIAEAINYKPAIALNYTQIGNFYLFAKSDYDKAINQYQLALSIYNESNDLLQTASVMEHIGECYYEKKDLAKALDFFQQSLAIEKKIKNVLNISYCYRNIGMIYNMQGNYDKALAAMPAALALAQQAEDKNSIGSIYECMGEIYMNKKDYRIAIDHLKMSLDIASEIGQKKNQMTITKDLASCYELLSDFKTANKYLNLYNALKDSLVNDETVRKNSEMEALYNSEKKDKAITLLTKDKQIQQLEIKKQVTLRNSFIIGVGLLLVLLFFIYRSYHNRQLLKLQTLRTKIASDLHDDIGSTLSSISIFSMMAKSDSKEIQPMLDQIGDNCRKMLDSMADIVWTINPENDNFEKIISRMRSFAFELLRTQKIDFEFNTDESVSGMKLSMEERKNLFLIFKEATNNMVKYAEADRATFTLKGSKNNLTMLIRDNGKGFDVNQPSQGNGLRNMRNRALEIGAKFLIESEPGRGTTIQLLFKTA